MRIKKVTCCVIYSTGYGGRGRGKDEIRKDPRSEYDRIHVKSDFFLLLYYVYR